MDMASDYVKLLIRFHVINTSLLQQLTGYILVLIFI